MEDDVTPPTPPTPAPAPDPASDPRFGKPPMPSRPQFATTTNQSPKPKKSKTWLWVLLVLVLLAAVAAGVYFWQDMRMQELQKANASLRQQVSSLQAEHSQENESEEAAAQGAVSSAENLVTGQVSQEAAASDAVVTCHVKPGAVSELWVQYGETVAVAQKTATVTEGLEAGDASEGSQLSEFSVNILADELTNGRLTFYQCAGLSGEETVTGGVAAFVTRQ